MLGFEVTYPWVTFLTIAAVKGIIELWVAGRCQHGGEESSQGLSRIFVIVGLATPLLIGAELLYFPPTIPLPVCGAFALLEAGLLALRIHCVRALGPYYSVHIRIVPGHQLVQKGVYRYLRNPLYLIALLEPVAYPLAAGAWRAMVIVVLLQAPPVLWRRRLEDARLRQAFGESFEAYQRRTWF